MEGIGARFITVLQCAEGGDMVVKGILGFLEIREERGFARGVGGTSGGEE